MVEYDERYLVQEPKIGLNYHLNFARKKGMVWKLVEIKGQSARLVTPKTKKPIKCHVSCLRETNRRAYAKRDT